MAINGHKWYINYFYISMAILPHSPTAFLIPPGGGAPLWSPREALGESIVAQRGQKSRLGLGKPWEMAGWFHDFMENPSINGRWLEVFPIWGNHHLLNIHIDLGKFDNDRTRCDQTPCRWWWMMMVKGNHPPNIWTNYEKVSDFFSNLPRDFGEHLYKVRPPNDS